MACAAPDAGRTATTTAQFLTAELNLFLLKNVLWIPENHWLNVARSILIACSGCAALKETYMYLTDRQVKRFGEQSWVLAATILVEVMVAYRFGPHLFSRVMPREIKVALSVGALTLTVWTAWWFGLRRQADESRRSLRRHPNRAATKYDPSTGTVG